MATYTYDVTIGSSKDRARALLGDTGEDVGQWLIADETYYGFLGQLPFTEAVAQMALSLASRFAKQPTWYEDEGGTRMKWEDRKQAWLNLAAEIRKSSTPEDLNYTGSQYMSAFLPLAPRAKVSHYGEPGMRTGLEGLGRFY